MTINNGFVLKKSTIIKEINSEVQEYEHIKTKAKLLYLKNDDHNKTFTIGFKTIPENSTGVAHILEHSVLCGSEKYNIKEPFVELLKGSLNTFLNAMTFSDKTLYPVASQNDEDFQNLIDVYCDAVFNPNIKHDKRIFLQEGWHFEFDDNNKLIVNGVVYNEMKGAMSNPLQLLSVKSDEAMFNNCYHYVSGGEPKDISNLTYEQFINFYNKYYHPSNSCIVLYGDCKLDEILSLIDSYLLKYEYKQIDNTIKPTAPITEPIKITSTYNVNNDDKSKSFVAIQYLIDKSANPKMNFVFNVLSQVLFNSEASPIKHELLANELCSDMSAYYDDYKSQSIMKIVVQNTEAEKTNTICQIIDDGLKKLVANGINKDLLEASVNDIEFFLREITDNPYPNGIRLSIDLINQWTYDENNIINTLYYEDLLKEIKDMINGDKFEKIVEKYLINNIQKVIVTLKPEKNLADKKNNAEKVRLQVFLDSLTEQEVDKIKKETEELKLRQSTPDTPEQLKCMKLLKISDIDKNITSYKLQDEKINNTKLLYYDVHTNGIVYCTIKFDTSDLNEEEIKFSSLMSYFMSMLSTDKYNYMELSNEIMRNVGGLSFRTSAMTDLVDTNLSHRYFDVYFKALSCKTKNAIELIDEIMFTTIFDDNKRLLQVLSMIKNNFQRGISNKGHQMAMMRISSMLSQSGKYNDIVSGIGFYEFLRDITDSFEENSQTIIEKLKLISKKVFKLNNLIITLTCCKEDKNKFVEYIKPLIDKLKKANDMQKQNLTLTQKSQAIKTTSNVQYVGMGYNFKILGYEYKGSYQVLKTILRTDYLWNNIRVLGGAYGAMANIGANGAITFCSYRDPQLLNTLKVYKEAGQYIKSLDIDNNELNKYILGTMQDIDAPKLPEAQGQSAVINYLVHSSDERRQKLRDEILNTTADDIKSAGEMVENAINKGLIVVVGDANNIEKNKVLFDEILSV